MKRMIFILSLAILTSCSVSKETSSVSGYEVRTPDGNKWITKGFIQDGFYDEHGNHIVLFGEYKVTPIASNRMNKQRITK